MNSLQLFGIKKNRPPKAWQSHAMGSGGHQTDSKPASVLANEASIEVENRQNCLTHYGIKGIIESVFTDSSQTGRIQTFVLSQENQSHSRNKMQVQQDEKNRRENDNPFVLHIFTVIKFPSAES
jgi:hypothetical protein